MKFTSLIFTIFFVSCQMSQAADFTVRSAELPNGSTLSNKYVYDSFGCSGKNVSPEINWENAPKETKSFAVTVYDPDAPTGSGWWHWLVINIPANYKNLASGFGGQNKAKLKDNITQIHNDFGTFSYGGACPPKGDKPHRYIFTVYALRGEKINLEENATAALAGYMINQNVLAKASFTAYYGR